MRQIRHDTPHALDQLLDNASPLTREEAAAFESTHGFDELFERIVANDGTAPVALDPAAGPGRRSRRRHPSRKSIVSIALAASLVVGGATAAAAKWTSVHTGSYGQVGATENDTSEWLNLAGDDLPQVEARIGKDILYPPGDSASAYSSMVGRSGWMQADGIKMVLTSDAACAWWGYWLQAEHAGNAVEQARATAVLQQVPTWPIVVETDGGGVVDQDRQIAAAARAGAPGVIQQAFTANCLTLPQRWAHK